MITRRKLVELRQRVSATRVAQRFAQFRGWDPAIPGSDITVVIHPNKIKGTLRFTMDPDKTDEAAKMAKRLRELGTAGPKLKVYQDIRNMPLPKRWPSQSFMLRIIRWFKGTGRVRDVRTSRRYTPGS